MNPVEALRELVREIVPAEAKAWREWREHERVCGVGNGPGSPTCPDAEQHMQLYGAWMAHACVRDDAERAIDLPALMTHIEDLERQIAAWRVLEKRAATICMGDDTLLTADAPGKPFAIVRAVGNNIEPLHRDGAWGFGDDFSGDLAAAVLAAEVALGGD